MQTQPPKTFPNPLYEKNSFVIVEDQAAKHDFSLCLLEKDAYAADEKVKAIVLRRDDERGLNYFKRDREDKISVQRILFATEDVDMLKKKQADDQADGQDDVKIFIPKTKYQQICSQVKDALAERSVFFSESGESDSEAADGNQEIQDLKVQKEDRKKALAKRRVRIAKRLAFDANEELGPDGKRIRDSNGITIKISRKKQPQLAFKKGKSNPFVQILEQSTQFEGQADEPDFSCCQTCNNKEILRAVFTNNEILLDNVLKSRYQITGLDVTCGPKSSLSVYKILLQSKNYKLFLRLVNGTEKIYFASVKPQSGFSVIDTGFNDKFAYGVQTRRVEMSRGSREGTNAFTYSDTTTGVANSSPNLIEAVCKHLDDEDVFTALQAYQRQIIQSLESSLWNLVLFGNQFLLKRILKGMWEKDGFGIGEFHYLAVAAESVNDITALKKVNVKKAAFENSKITPMHLVCLNPNPDIVSKFLEIGEEAHISDEQLRKPIHYAALCSSPESLRILLGKGLDSNDPDKNRTTPLMYAAMAGRAANIKLLCELGQQKVNRKDKFGNAAIHYAVKFNKIEAIEELLTFGANINLKAANGLTSLMIAVQQGDLELVKFLLSKKARLLTKDKFKKSALIHAIIAGHVKIASYFLEIGSEFYAPDSSENTPLHYACAYGFYELIDLLIKAGADINAVNSWNLKPIFVALVKDHFRCVLKLVSFPNIDVNCKDNNGLTLLLINVIKFTRESLDFSEYLTKNTNADAKICDDRGNSGLHYLASKIIKKDFQNNFLIAKQKHVEETSRFESFFKMFVDSGIDVNQKNSSGQTPLEIAVNASNWRFVELIIDHPDLHLNIINSSGKTLVHSCGVLFASCKRMYLLEKMVRKLWLSAEFHSAFDDNGLNFYHSLFESFLQNYNSGFSFNIHQKITSLTKNLESPREKTEEEREALNSQLKSFRERHLNIQNLSLENFSRFNGLLGSLDYDFSIRVALVRETYSSYQQRVFEDKQKGLVGSKRDIQFSTNENELIRKFNEGWHSLDPEMKMSSVINAMAGANVLFLVIKTPVPKIFDEMTQILKSTNRFQPNSRNYKGETMLLFSLRNQSCFGNWMPALIGLGDDVNTCDAFKNYPIHLVAQSSSLQLLLDLIKQGANLNVANKNGESPLLQCVKQANVDKIKVLLENGADINMKDNNERNCLHWAISNSVQGNKANLIIEDILIKGGIDVNAIDSFGRTPLHYFFASLENMYFVSSKDPIELFSDYLINKNLVLDHPDYFGNTPLSYAVEQGAYLCVILLQKRGVNLNHINYDGNRPLALSLLANQATIAIYLLQQNIDINIWCYEIDFKAREQWLAKQKLKLKENQSNSETQMIIENDDDKIVELGRSASSFSNYPVLPVIGRIYLNDSKTLAVPSFHYEILAETTNIFCEDIHSRINRYLSSSLPTQKRGFVTKISSSFDLAALRSIDTVTYLLIASGFNISLGIMSMIKQGKWDYAEKLLNKRLFDNEEDSSIAYNAVTNEGRNLFHALALNSHSISSEVCRKFVEVFIKNKVNINRPDNFGFTPAMYFSIRQNLSAMLNVLVAAGMTVDEVHSSGNNLITCFIQFNNQLKSHYKYNQAKLQDAFDIKNMNRPNARQIDSFTVRELIEIQNPNIKVQNSIDLIQGLSKLGKFDLNQQFWLLKENSRHINGAEFFNVQPKATYLLFFAARKLKNLALVNFLLENGADINITDRKGYTILTDAIVNNNLLLITFLLNFSQQINFGLVDKHGKTYIHHIVSSIRNCSYHNVKLLKFFATRTDINRPDNAGYPPIFYARQQDSGLMASHLMDIGATDFSVRIQRIKTSIVGDLQYEESKYDFEEDLLNYVEKMEAKTNGQIEYEQKAKPNSRLVGNFELIYNKSNGKPYDVRLAKVDIDKGHYSANLFYLMQIVYEKKLKIYTVFTSWGRCGTLGQFQQTPFLTLEAAVSEFSKIFKQKTGNEYSSIDSFVKCPNKYRLVKTVVLKISNSLIRHFDLKDPLIPFSKLPAPTLSVMKFITDAKLYQTLYSRLQIDACYFQFGRIDFELLEKAEAVLEELRVLTKRMREHQFGMAFKDAFELATQISEKTAEYFELLPTTDYKEEALPIFTIERIELELKRIYEIRLVGVSARILAAANYRIHEINPLDYCFAALGIKMVPLDSSDNELQIIKMYLKTGVSQNLKSILKNVLAIERKGENERFQPWLQVGNRRLLWHGTRSENLMPILYNGLRIAPSDARYTGSSLGKGIYFSDAFQRSISYSASNSSSVFIILAEVALGKMKKFSPTDNFEMDNQFQSVKASGRNVHEKSQRIYMANGCMVPVGDLVPCSKSVNSNVNILTRGLVQTCEYNEYVVFDPSQVKIRYLIELDSKVSTRQNWC